MTTKPMTEPNELREKIEEYVDRFRKQWTVEGDEYYQDDLVDDIIELLQSEIDKAYWRGNQRAIIEESKRPRTTICGVCSKLQTELQTKSVNKEDE